MTFSPDKFFIGLMDFFSIILPGALLTYTTWHFAVPYFSQGGFEVSSTEKNTIIFLFASYMGGHFIFLLGSLLDTHLYDPIRKGTLKEQVSKLIKERELSPFFIRRLAELVFKKDVDSAAYRAMTIKERYLRPLQASSSINTFQWCKARLTLDHPTAISVVNRFEADSKFFRSFTVLLALLTVREVYQSEYGFALVSLCTMLLAFWRYADQRSKAVNQAYWYIITLEGNDKAQHSSNGSEALNTHAGGVVYRKKSSNIEYLIIQSSDHNHWVFPKGHIEDGEKEQATALREVKEETGVWALIGCDLGQHSFCYNCQTTNIQFYLMRSLRQGKPYDKGRKHRWLSFEKAVEVLSFDESRGLLKKAKEILEKDSNS